MRTCRIRWFLSGSTGLQRRRSSIAPLEKDADSGNNEILKVGGLAFEACGEPPYQVQVREVYTLAVSDLPKQASVLMPQISEFTYGPAIHM